MHHSFLQHIFFSLLKLFSFVARISVDEQPSVLQNDLANSTLMSFQFNKEPSSFFVLYLHKCLNNYVLALIKHVWPLGGSHLQVLLFIKKKQVVSLNCNKLWDFAKC